MKIITALSCVKTGGHKAAAIITTIKNDQADNLYFRINRILPALDPPGQVSAAVVQLPAIPTGTQKRRPLACERFRLPAAVQSNSALSLLHPLHARRVLGYSPIKASTFSLLMAGRYLAVPLDFQATAQLRRGGSLFFYILRASCVSCKSFMLSCVAF